MSMVIFSYNSLAVILTVLYGLFVAALATNFHEYSHYIFAKAQTTDVEIQRTYVVIAHRVDFHSPQELSEKWCRVTGIAPLIMGAMLLTYSLLVGHSNWLVEVALIGTSLGGFVLSPSDFLAILYPKEYIRRVEENGNFGHLELIQYIWRRSRD